MPPEVMGAISLALRHSKAASRLWYRGKEKRRRKHQQKIQKHCARANRYLSRANEETGDAV